jgi:uncharacterized phage protein (TIGR02218 family)
MKDVSEEYNAKELADVRKPVELYHVWFNDNDDVKVNKEWFFTNHDEAIYYGSNEINAIDPVSMQIISLDENSWQIGAAEGHPFKMFFVISLYEKYIEPYDAEWETNPEHVYGIYYWFQDSQFATLEESFYTQLVSQWSDIYPTIDNPYEGVPYDSENGILETSAFTASLQLNGFVNPENNIYVTITSLASDGNTINVPKNLYTLIEEPIITEIPYYDYDVGELEEWDSEQAEFPSGYVTQSYDRLYLPATLERENITYNSELDVQNVGVNFLYSNEVSIKFIAVNPVNLLWISILKLHKELVPQETDVIFLGQIKDVSFKGLQAKATCVSFSHFLKESIPIWRYQLTCNHRLFDSYCSLNKEDYKIQGTIVSINDSIIVLNGISTLDNGYLIGGEIKKNSESRKIISHSGTTITVAYVFTALQEEDVVDLYPGCNGRIEVCRDTFDNILHYLGFPFIPLEHENPAIRTDLPNTENE